MMTLKVGRRLFQCLLAAMSLVLSFGGQAADYPARPIKIVTGSTPGSSTDLVLRQFVDKMGPLLKGSVFVDNRPGANNVIAAVYVGDAAPDGYTLLFIASLPAYPMLSKAMTKDPVKDYAAISELVEGRLAFSVNPKTSWKTVDDMIADMKSAPGKYNYALASGGGILPIEMFKAASKADFVIVRYPGEAQASQAVMTGEAHFAINQVGQAKHYLDSGRLGILGVLGPKRDPLLPNVPAFGESKIPEVRGLANFTGFYSFWYGLFAPAGTPKDAINAVHIASVKAVHDPDFVSRIKNYFLEPVGNSPEEFSAIVAIEANNWRRVASDAKLQPQ